MNNRYQQVLLPCPGTSEKYHNTVAASGKTILELWENLDRFLFAGQLWEVRDTRLGKVLTPEEFQALVCKLKGWA